MSRFRVLALVAAVASCSLAVVLTSFDAAGDAPAGDAPKPDTFTTLVRRGKERYAAKDYPGAADVFKRAVQTSPRDPLGSYLLGEAHLASANLGEAESAFKAAAALDDPQTPPAARSRVLFAVADCYEREKKWEQARSAWQAYAEHAAKLAPDAGAHPESAAARLKVLDEWLRLEKQSEAVRERIAAENRDAAAPLASPPPKN